MLNRRIALGAAAVTAAALLLTACSSGGAGADSGGGKKTYTIGLAVANQQADFFNQIRQAAEAEGKKVGAKIITADAKGDPDTQVSEIQNFISQGVDAIIYIPAGATAATVPVKQAKAAHIPVVTVDRNPTGEPGDTFIATDSVKASTELGKYVAKLVPSGDLGVVQGQIGTTPQVDREKGFKAGIGDSGLKIVAEQASQQWAQDEGFNIATDMLQSHPGIKVFFGQADALALGAAQAAKQQGKTGITVVGFDGDPAGLTAVQDGTLAATICQQTQKMGRLAVTSAISLIEGKKLPKEQLQEGVLTTKDNVEPFIKNHP
ncbi:MAG: substrate-binding domain-containing protein [Leifsonia sp.]